MRENCISKVLRAHVRCVPQFSPTNLSAHTMMTNSFLDFNKTQIKNSNIASLKLFGILQKGNSFAPKCISLLIDYLV